MGKFQNLAGKKFGKWTVLDEHRSVKNNTQWLCRCSCGNTCWVAAQSLKGGVSSKCKSCATKASIAAKREDLSGQTFGEWTVLDKFRIKNGEGQWFCRCSCGKTAWIRASKLKNRTHPKCRSCTTGDKNRIHGMSETRLYKVWKNMKKRCYNQNCKDYKDYGGRGITVCDEWIEDYLAFYDWGMSNGYNPDAPKGECTIDRIDHDGNYEPSNCRWAPMSEQNRNKRKYKRKGALA